MWRVFPLSFLFAVLISMVNFPLDVFAFIEMHPSNSLVNLVKSKAIKGVAPPHQNFEESGLHSQTKAMYLCFFYYILIVVKIVSVQATINCIHPVVHPSAFPNLDAVIFVKH